MLSQHETYWDAVDKEYKGKLAKAEAVCKLADRLILEDKQTKKFFHTWIDMQAALHAWRGKPRSVK